MRRIGPMESPRRWPLVLAAMCMLGMQPAAVWAQQASAPVGQEAAEAPLRFLRVFVPADRVSDWPRENVPYVPMDAEEFERLLQMATAAANPAGQPSAVLVSGRYSARLTDPRRLVGEAEILVSPGGRPGTSIALGPCNLAITSAIWLDADSQPARLGRGATGDLKLLLESAERLQLQWMLRAVEENDQAPAFDFRLPACRTNTLVLELPQDLTPEVDRGVVIDEGTTADSLHRWRIELGGHHRVAVRLMELGGSTAAFVQPRVRQSTIYRVMPEGLELTCKVQLNVPAGSLQQLTVRPAPQLRITEVTCNGEPIRWRHAWAAPAEQQNLVVLLPQEPLQGEGHTLEISGVSPTTLGKVWRLPRVDINHVLWLEGGATVLVAPQLLVNRLIPVAGRRQVPAVAPEAELGEVFQIQFFEPTGGVELVLGRNRPQLEVESGTWIEATPAHTVAHVAVVARVKRQASFSLETNLEPPWQIQSVETIPGDLLADWDVLEDDAGTGTRKLHLELSKPVGPGTKLRLRITARRSALRHDSPIPVARLLPVSFPEARSGRHWAWLAGSVTWTIDQPGQLAKPTSEDASPSPDLLALFTQPPSGKRIDVGAGSAQTVRAGHAEKVYRGHLEVTLHVRENRVRQVFRFRCTPEAGKPVERIRVGFSPGGLPSLAWRWSLAAENRLTGDDRDRQPRESVTTLLRPSTSAEAEKQTLLARQVPPAPGEKRESQQSGHEKVELWEVVLPQPLSIPFEVQAETTWPLEDGAPVSLAWLADAVEQQASISIRSDRPLVLSADPHRLSTVQSGTGDLDDRAGRWPVSAFRYSPPEEGASLQGALWIGPSETSEALPVVWAHRCWVQSWYEPSGLSHHLVAYELETRGKWELEIKLPEGVDAADLEGVWINGNAKPIEPAGSRLTVPLPDDVRFVAVWLAFRCQESPLVAVDRRRPPVPETNVPVLECQWTAWLPSGYRLLSEPQPENQSNWFQRLLGPLVRPAHGKPFDPFHLADWQYVVGKAKEPRPAAEAVDALLNTLGAATASNWPGSDPPMKTWGDVLLQAATRAARIGTLEAGKPVELWIDPPAMARVGITPTVAVPHTGSPPDAPPEEQALELLRREGLALVVDSRTLVLTDQVGAVEATGGSPPGPLPASLPALAVFGTGIPTRSGVVFQGTGSNATERGLLATGVWNDRTLVPVTHWAAKTPTETSPWELPRLPGRQPADWPGWNPRHLSFPLDSPPTIVLVHRTRLAVVYWVAFLVAAAVGIWCLRIPAIVLGLMGFAAAAALWLPIPWADLASGVLLGLLAAVGLALVRRPRAVAKRNESRSGCRITSSGEGPPVGTERPPSPEPNSDEDATDKCPRLDRGTGNDRTGSSAGSAGEQWADGTGSHHRPGGRNPGGFPPGSLPLLIFVLLITCCRLVGAQEKPQRGGKPHTYRVLIPMDENRQPSGDKYQIPEGFYNELVRRAEAVSDRWLIEAASYKGSLTQDAESGRIVLPRLEIGYRLRVLSAPAQVSIPVGVEQSRLVADRFRIDGRTTAPKWDSSRRAILVDLVRSGVHEVRFDLTPPATTQDQWTVVDLPIPAISDAQLELVLPSEPVEVELPSALGHVSSDPDNHLFRATVGPAKRLSLRWKSHSAQRSQPEVEELLWLKVSDGATVFHTRLKLQSDSPLPETLRIAVDPHLRLTWSDAQARVLEPQQANLPSIVEVPIAGTSSAPTPARGSSAMVELRFLQVPGSGIGRTLLPYFDVLGARVTRRWLAVSVGEGIDWRHELYEPLEVVAPSAFAQAWQSETPPLAAWSLPNSRTAWSVLAWPTAPQITAEQHLGVCFGRNFALVAFEAQLDLKTARLFDQRISAPAALEVDSVRVVHQQIDWPIRWTKLRTGQIQLFFDRPITGTYQIVIRARLPVTTNANNPLPALQVEGADRSSLTWNLFRRSNTLVELVKTDGWNRVESAEMPQNTFPQAIPVGSFQSSPQGAALPAVVVRANRPTVRAEQRSIVRRSDGRWWTDVHLQFHVTNGVADRFLILVREPGSRPWKAEPPAEVQPLETRSDGSQLLAIVPPSPVSGTWSVKLTAEIVARGNRELAVPVIVPQHVHVQKHWFLLPEKVDGRPARWRLGRLEPAELPEELSPEVRETRQFRAYLATGRNPRASLLLPAGPQSVLLMEIAAKPATGRLWVLRVRCLTMPEASRQWRFSLPRGYRVLEASIDGLPVSPQRLRENAWWLPLESGRSPCWIDLLCLADIGAEPSSPMSLAAPKVEGFEVDRVLWKLTLPNRRRVRVPSSLFSARPATVLEATTFRMEALLAAAQPAAQLASDTGVPERWVARWLHLWQQSSSSARAPSGAEVADDSVQQTAINQLEVLKQQGKPFVDQWQSALGRSRSTASSSFPLQEHDTAAWAALPDSHVEYWLADGVATPLQLAASESSTMWNRRRIAAGIVFLLMALAAVTPAVQSAMKHFFCRWPHLTGTAFGLAWWLWLQPSVLGWVIVACCLIGAMRSARWSFRASRGTVVIRVS